MWVGVIAKELIESLKREFIYELTKNNGVLIFDL